MLHLPVWERAVTECDLLETQKAAALRLRINQPAGRTWCSRAASLLGTCTLCVSCLCSLSLTFLCHWL